VADFVIPELGENVTGGDVVRILVKAGDALKKEQPVLELETDKATIEVPSSVAGVVKDLKVKTGDKVKVGQLVLTVDEAAQGAAAGDGGGQAGGAEPESGAKPEAGGAKAPPPQRTSPAAKSHEELAGAEPPLGEELSESKQEAPSKVVEITRGAQRPATAPAAAAQASPAGASNVPAAPSTRRYARELGVDITSVEGTGPGGRVSIDDVHSTARAIILGGGGGGRVPTTPLPDFSQWGEVERVPLRSIRKKTAERLAEAWATIPHVTQFDKADITELEKLRQKYSKNAEAAGGKLTITAIALKVIAAALKAFPQFNTSIDVAGESMVMKKYTHIGVAVDTDRGLLVPVIRDVDKKSIVELSVELAAIAEKTKAGKLQPSEMQGASFTISNLGGIGGTYFTPIVNPPEVAILGISRSSTEPVWTDDAFEPRLMMPLSLSYDHRVIDGATGIRFLRWVAEAFEQPFLMSL
jgi:pyruvate dehydrogenase E2 component (dihydrolipoyllysine-residue acetyltransferase)